MTRRTMVLISGSVLLLAAVTGGSGYLGFVVGQKVQLQDSFYCTAGHTRTYVRLLEDLYSGEVSRATGLIETNVDAGVILLNVAPEYFAHSTAEFVKETLSQVREQRQKHPWVGGSPELRERVGRALAKGM